MFNFIKYGCLIWVVLAVIFMVYEGCESIVEKKRNNKLQVALANYDFEEARSIAEKFDGGGISSKRDEALDKVTLTQCTYMIDAGEINAAYRIAKEDDRAHIFYNAYIPRLSELYKDSGEDNVLLMLSKVEFKEVFYPNYPDHYNNDYNKEINTYNSNLEQFILYLCATNNRSLAKKIVPFIKSIAVEDPTDDDKSVLSNEPQRLFKRNNNL